ncbi:ubiquinol--cytochrome-c reductase subunit 6 [Coemansia sp. RSA 1853]|nr:ubiquinol--cytochrome-c reductase subunit 6 [Coemansia sp. RSA 1853]
MSFFDLINPFSYVTPFHADGDATEESVVVAADAVEAEAIVIEQIEESNADEETEEEEEAEDKAPLIKEGCGETLACKSLKHHYDECAARVENGSSESCAEEFLHFMECVDHCAASKIFAQLK